MDCSNEDRVYMLKHGAVEAVFELLATKAEDLNETPMVYFLYLCLHPTLPEQLIRRGIIEKVVPFLYAEDDIIRELSVIVLKALILFNSDAVDEAVPEEKKYLMQRDIYNPQLFGGEYCGLIQEYLQTIVENRREYNYLFDCFTKEELMELQLTPEELEVP